MAEEFIAIDIELAKQAAQTDAPPMTW